MPTLEEKLRPVFAPAQTSPPLRVDVYSTEILLKYLDQVAPLETREDRAVRERLLLDLQQLMGEWVRHASINAGIPEEDAPTGQLFISGSYRLGVNQKGGDIDTILVVPQSVSRDDFFNTSEDGLVGRLQSNPNVTHLLAIPTAKVPLIKVVWRNIEVDVLFAQIPGSKLPRNKDDLLNDNFLVRADEGTVLSLNGPRVTELIIELVPNYETFCIVLRALRLWGKRRGIYSNKMGFLGGVNFAILAAFICQLYPKETPSRLIVHMFNLLNVWKWPNPIRLNHPYEGPDVPVQQWNPEKFVGREDKMPIITPAYPNTNSSYNVTAATLKVMKREFERGLAETRRVLALGEQVTADDWARVFADSDFFFRFPTYICIDATAVDAEALKKWTGYVESRLRKLVGDLERSPLFDIFPFPASFSASEFEHGTRWFVGLQVDPVKARAHAQSVQTKAVNIEGVVEDFLRSITAWPDRTEGMVARIDLVKFKDMLTRFPGLYAACGVKEAIAKHAEIQADTKLRIDKHYSTAAPQAVAPAAEDDALAPEPSAKRPRTVVRDVTCLPVLPDPGPPHDAPRLYALLERVTPRHLKVDI